MNDSPEKDHVVEVDLTGYTDPMPVVGRHDQVTCSPATDGTGCHHAIAVSGGLVEYELDADGHIVESAAYCVDDPDEAS